MEIKQTKISSAHSYYFWLNYDIFGFTVELIILLSHAGGANDFWKTQNCQKIILMNYTININFNMLEAKFQ